MLSIIAAILVFSTIVLVHELGHFLLAKKNGIKVVEFSIGMGPRLFSKRKGETLYSIKLLPIGGSCMMLGEDEDAQDERAFGSKSVWARMSVILAGPVFNFILAFVFSVILVAFSGYDSAEIIEVSDGSPAFEAGIMPGDRITSVNKKKVVIYRDFLMYAMMHPGESMNIELERTDATTGELLRLKTTVTPQYSETYGRYLIGISISQVNIPAGSVINVLKYGIYEVKFNITSTMQSLAMLFSGKIGVNDLSGPVGIVVMIDDSVKAGMTVGIGAVIANLLGMSILLSANLGVMNLLPIPALDGGRMVFLIIEAVRGKRIDPEKEGIVNIVGFVALMGLMLFVVFHDIARFF